MPFWQMDTLLSAKSNGSRPGYGLLMTTSDIYSNNQKETLMSLNSRLEAYLENVHMLEEANQQLEEKIKEASKIQKVGCDHSHYQKTIEDLESQIRSEKQANCQMILNIENTRRMADGFKEKYEAELTLKNTIADDVKKLKATRSGLEMENRCMKVEVKILMEEVENIRKDHKEVRERLLQEKSKCKVNIEVDNMNTPELTASLEKMRQQYTEIANNHQKHYEALLAEKFKETNQQNSQDTELLRSQMRHLYLLRRTVQDLETEREVQHSLKTSQEEALKETEASYITQLEHIQNIVLRLEDELEKVRLEAENLASDSRILCYLKDLLEMEIRTYGLLMDDEENRIESVMSEPSPRVPHNRQKSVSVINKNPPAEGLSSMRSKCAGTSGIQE